MLYMSKELYAIRLDPKMKKEIVLISKVLHISESEWIRNKIAYDIKEALDTLRTQIALEYAKGNITKMELQEIFGYEAARLITFALRKVKSDYEKAQKIAQTIPKKSKQ